MTAKGLLEGWGSMTQAPDAWLKGCTALSEASQAVAQRWFQACNDQAQRNVAAFTQLGGCKDPSEVLAIQQRWWAESVERLSAELKDCQDQLGAAMQQGGAPTPKPRSHRPVSAA